MVRVYHYTEKTRGGARHTAEKRATEGNRESGKAKYTFAVVLFRGGKTLVDR